MSGLHPADFGLPPNYDHAAAGVLHFLARTDPSAAELAYDTAVKARLAAWFAGELEAAACGDSEAPLSPCDEAPLPPYDEVERVFELNTLGAPDEIYDVFSCQNSLQAELIALLEKLQAAQAAGAEVGTLTLVDAIRDIELWLGGLRRVTGLAHAEASSGSFH